MQEPIPNLFIIGAMKAATTSLHYYLAAHPAIFMCEPKEPGYLVPELRAGRDLDWYLGLFRDGGAARWRGESSTHYTKLPIYRGVPERLYALNHDPRLIYVMRDPIERLVSQYFHSLRMGVDGDDQRFPRERRSLTAAVRADPGYLAFGDYARQLAPWIERFGRRRIFVLTSERLIADPAGTLAEITAWLGEAPDFPPEIFARRWNQTPEQLARLRGFGLLNRLRHSRVWGRVAAHVPAPLRRAAARLACAPVEKRAHAEEIARVTEQVRPIVERQVADLSRLLGRDFPEWRTSCPRAAQPGGLAPEPG